MKAIIKPVDNPQGQEFECYPHELLDFRLIKRQDQCSWSLCFFGDDGYQRIGILDCDKDDLKSLMGLLLPIVADNFLPEPIRRPKDDAEETQPPSEWYDLDHDIHTLAHCFYPAAAYPATPRMLPAMDYMLAEVCRGELATTFSLWDDQGHIGNYIVATVDFDNHFKKRSQQ